MTETDPCTYDDVLVDAQTKYDKNNDKDVGSPYKIGNVILWADDYESKAYGSVVETTTGYHFCGFTGYAQFPESEGSYAYRVEDGISTLLPYRKVENAWKISSDSEVELYDEPLEEIVAVTFFSKKLYVKTNRVLHVLAKILPDQGFVTAEEKTRVDVEVDTRDDVVAKIQKPIFDSSDTYRFTLNTNTLKDLQFVRKSIAEDGCCVAASLYSEEKGEYLAVIYGYTGDGDLLLADMNTLKPVGALHILESARKIMNEAGELVSVSYYDFDGLGFDSTAGDRISFFAAASSSEEVAEHFAHPEEALEDEDSKMQEEE